MTIEDSLILLELSLVTRLSILALSRSSSKFNFGDPLKTESSSIKLNLYGFTVEDCPDIILPGERVVGLCIEFLSRSAFFFKDIFDFSIAVGSLIVKCVLTLDLHKKQEGIGTCRDSTKSIEQR